MNLNANMPEGFAPVTDFSKDGQSQVINASKTLQYYKSTYGYKSIREMEQDHFLSYTYSGTNGYRTGAFLKPFPAENENYNFRKESAFYANYFKKICNAITFPATNDVERKTENDVISAFIENVDDGCYGEMEQYMKKASDDLFTYSYTLSILSSQSTEGGKITRDQLISGRAFPVASLVDPMSIAVGGDVADSRGKLVSLTLIDSVVMVDKKEVQIYYTVDDKQYSTWYYSDDKKTKINYGEPIEHGLGFIPVVGMRMGKPEKSGLWRPIRQQYDIAIGCWTIFNLISQLYDTLEKAGAPLLVFQGMLDGDITIGGGAVMQYSIDAKNKPEYIAMDSRLADMYMNFIQKISDMVFTMADESGVTASESKQAKSGIAHAFVFRGKNEKIKNSSCMLEQYEKNIVAMMCKIQKEPNDYVVEYPDDFSNPEEITIQDALSVVESPDMAPSIRREAQLVIARTLMGDMYEAKEDELKDAVEGHNYNQNPNTVVTDGH
jgi:hypothetical protein